MPAHISDEQWARFEKEGYLRLGKVMDDDELAGLQQRIDDIMLGNVKVYDQMYMQLDSETGDYSEKRITTKGHQVSTLNYRKIQDLEFDPLFLSYMQKPLFREICARAYGPETPISCYRAMFINKPAGKGTYLPWHQDRFGLLNTDPIATLWTALDRVSVENGCVGIVPGSHRGTFEQDDSAGFAFLTDEQATAVLAGEAHEYLEMEAGETALLHNWLLHGSGVNKTNTSRRAFSVCYMDAATRSDRGNAYSVIFGEGAMSPASL
jgi:phytanoyl-CoA hydroxylase